MFDLKGETRDKLKNSFKKTKSFLIYNFDFINNKTDLMGLC